MTRTFVGAAVLAALVAAPLTAQRLSPDCSQPSGTGVEAASAGDNQPVSKPSGLKTAQPEIPFPPRFDLGWLAPLFRLGAITPPKQPEWFPLDPKSQKRVDDLLAEWEAANSQVDRFEIAFQRWEFEPVFGPRDGKTPNSFATGVIKFQEPNKAMWRVDTIKKYVAPAQAGDKPSYVIPKDEFGEHWVCDGQSIFEFDYRRKTLIERRLPPELQGKAIGDGNFPLLYGRSAAAISQRYWIRPLSPPAGVENEYWLELWPRNPADAAAYKFIVVVIAQSDMRLAGLSFVARNYDAKMNPARIDYRFDNRNVALKGSVERLRLWELESRQPKAPLGWRKEVQKFASPTPAPNTKELSKQP